MGDLILLSNLSRPLRLIELSNATQMASRTLAENTPSTSGVTHNVRLPRRRRPASYSAQLFTRNFILGMWRRRGELCLFGMEGAAFQYSVPEYPIFTLSMQQGRLMGNVVYLHAPTGKFLMEVG